MTTQPPIEWVLNPRAADIAASPAVASNFPEGVFAETRDFHRQIPGYQPSPLRSLPRHREVVCEGKGGLAQGCWHYDAPFLSRQCDAFFPGFVK